MTREEVLDLINEVVDAPEALNENTVISLCEDIDSLSLLSIFMELKKLGTNCIISDFIKCETIADVISLAIEKQ